MGILLIVGFAVIAGRIVYVLATAGDTAHTASDPVNDDRRPFAATLTVPHGSTVRDLAATSDRVTILVQEPDGRERLYVLDPKTGTITGSVTLAVE